MPRTKKIVKLMNEKRRARENKLAQEKKESDKQDIQFKQPSTSTNTTTNENIIDDTLMVKGGTQSKGDKIKLSPLQLKMQRKLSGAQFRLINEQLYTIESDAALVLMTDKPSLFSVVNPYTKMILTFKYHEGFRSQVETWPQNPLDQIIAYCKTLANVSIADMGCGDAQLSLSLKESNPDITVHSFDLVSINPNVIACDVKHCPLKDGECDVVVFCLALMGTNFLDFIREANRIMKVGGVLKIAEVESRFTSVDDFVSAVESIGFSIQQKNVNQKMFYSFTFVKCEKGEVKKRKRDDGKDAEEVLLKPCIYKRR